MEPFAIEVLNKWCSGKLRAIAQCFSNNGLILSMPLVFDGSNKTMILYMSPSLKEIVKIGGVCMMAIQGDSSEAVYIIQIRHVKYFRLFLIRSSPFIVQIHVLRQAMVFG